MTILKMFISIAISFALNILGAFGLGLLMSRSDNDAVGPLAPSAAGGAWIVFLLLFFPVSVPLLAVAVHKIIFGRD